MTRRVMMLGFDGFEPTLADAMIARGLLPAFGELRRSGAVASLDHGDARRTGLAWEHVATGLSPDDAKRWAAVDFDPATYQAVQRPTRLKPFPGSLDIATLVFDVPYFDLIGFPDVQGVVAWGAHDPGTPQSARPHSLLEEMQARFGPYPATPWTYGFVWPSAERTAEMGRALVEAVQTRFAATEWLFAERCPDWRLGMMVVSEFHSAAEAMWHGVDPAHPLHGEPSSAAARAGLEAVYRAADTGLARLRERLPDTDFIVFNLHGMGANDSDPGSMALLAELMFRDSFGRPLLRTRRWQTNAEGVPLLGEGEGWEKAVSDGLGLRCRLSHLGARLKRKMFAGEGGDELPLSWMPAERYSRFWPRMRAFALPSFYDGRIRINLAGRERAGLVPLADYESTCDEIETLLRECRDPRTGREAVSHVERSRKPPLGLGSSESDLIILWKDAPLGLVHPTLGTMGPVPYRRTGGHSGGDGFAWIAGPGIGPARLGRRSAFDIVPTAIELLGLAPLPISGESFARKLRETQPAA